MATASRQWCAKIQYPDKEPIFVGSVTVAANAKQHEIEQAVKEMVDKHLPEGWTLDRHIPEGWTLIDLVPGYIVFVPEE